MSQENGDIDPRDDKQLPNQRVSACGPTCGCNSSKASGHTRLALGALVLIATVALAGRAVLKGNGASAQASTAAFAAPQSDGKTPSLESGDDPTSSDSAPVAAVAASAEAPVAEDVASAPVQKDVRGSAAPAATEPSPVAASAPPTPVGAAAEAPETTPMACCGEPILSLGDLNQVAMDKDGVFVFLAGKDAAKARDAVTVIEKAAATIRGNGIEMGLFTLGDGSPEYANLAAQVPPPGVVALVKGRGASAVTGEITESRLVQAFVAASSGGGCGSGGASCGPASAGCR